MPPYDATAVARLRRAGALVLGKCNCDAFAMGSTTEASDYQARLHLSPLHLNAVIHIYDGCQGPAHARHAMQCVSSVKDSLTSWK